jgi:3-oxoacyl-[acyl-carrier protein] reductase
LQLVKEGFTANEFWLSLVQTDVVQSVPRITRDRIPLRGFGFPEEVVEVAVMLARNGYITGQSISFNADLNPTSS